MPVSTGLGFLSSVPVFYFCVSVPLFHRKFTRQDRLGATIPNSVDPQHPPLEAHFTFPKVDRGFVKSALHGSVLRFEPYLELGIELVKAFFHPTGDLGPAPIFEGGNGNSQLQFDRVLGLKITAAVAADDF